MIKAIIFDFDGVILESVHVKTKAFITLFSNYPEQIDQIKEFLLKNGGMNRFEKFETIYRDILQTEVATEEIELLGQEFSQLVFAEVTNAPFVPGAKEFIESNSRKYSLAIASATPEPELRRIVELRGLSQYFSSVLGAPANKAQNLLKILSRHQVKPIEAIFIGDSRADYEGARKAGIPFIARVVPGSDVFDGIPVLGAIEDLKGLDAILRTCL
ncbi:HAD family hydrolase [Geobacter sp. DSM 9736]|uniref:HAD family hydrolase n=1 Tax=Geobacter sp. DSM 9736 TaxID=1277350 RepID=UPI000B60390B|nr:HAD family hydrolase [Geobacter sp. DSM 9736]SNB47007.1 haloacid dehalogenase superfamily, subfamily IA, variant 1 with third motif having Dx(3-4)D or Dx(3-4)E [Geobacter sp. DSM 9736]